MAAIDTSELVQYPIVRCNDLTIDPVYLELQRERGSFRAQLPYGEPCWVTTRYEDVKLVYGDRRFVKGLGTGRDGPRMMEGRIHDDPSIIAQMDPPRHTRIRRLTSGAFAPAEMRKMSGWLDDIANELVDTMEERGGTVDLVEVMSWTLPLRVLTGILGVPESEIATFRGWIDQLMNVESSVEAKGEAIGLLIPYIQGLIDERRAQHTGDLLSVMVQARDDNDQLTEDELVSLALTLFLAGFETTAAQIGNTVFTLMTHRDRWRELLDDRDLVRPAMEELWRWIPSFRHGMPMIQWASEDIELSGGVVIPAGEPVVPEHQLANRDETVFEHASEIDFHRVDPQPHLSLAWGAHRCLGANLANLEIEATLQALLRRLPTLELAVAPNDVTWSTHTFLRSPEELLVTW
jgi:cytochrome P450